MEGAQIVRNQLIFLAVGAPSVGLLFGWVYFLPFLCGGFLGVINVVGTSFAWPRILEKKSVALSVGIIVSKFALSIGVLYWLTTPSAFDRFNLWVLSNLPVEATKGSDLQMGSTFMTLIVFSAGLASILPAVLGVFVGENLLKSSSTGDPNEPPVDKVEGRRRS
ncbi:MAG: hypothetical protein J0L82_02420 [Deltaproteobacteria bacterium]|nr:hypothetical protein [Deltaproteobacteria bacterium]